MEYYDLHCHVLPGMDDGAKDVEEAKQMLRLLKQQGVTKLVLTSHYISSVEDVQSFLKRRQEAFDRIRPFLDELGMEYRLGAEVSFSDGTHLLSGIEKLCVEGTDFLLIEVPFYKIDLYRFKKMLYNLMASKVVVPVLVHPERYSWLFKRRYLEFAVHNGCLVQCNIDSLRHFFLRKKLIRFVRAGFVHFLSSDCHDMAERKPSFDLLAKGVLPDKMTEKLFKNVNDMFF